MKRLVMLMCLQAVLGQAGHATKFRVSNQTEVPVKFRIVHIENAGPIYTVVGKEATQEEFISSKQGIGGAGEAGVAGLYFRFHSQYIEMADAALLNSSGSKDPEPARTGHFYVWLDPSWRTQICVAPDDK